jgi:hemoglobin-like flavoprotein
LDKQNQDLVRHAWARAAAAHVDMARLFYGRLFKIAPETRVLFSTDMDQQGRKLVATLGFVVDHLSDEATLVPAAQDLAIRHLNYNVKKEHYAAVGASLLWTLEELLGGGFTPEVANAWAEIFTTIETVMTEAAYPSETSSV